MSNDLSDLACRAPVNDVFKTIYARRSIRDYRPEDVPDHVIRELIKAGTYAPSAVNKQPWRFVIIKERELMKKLSDRAKELWTEQDVSASNPDIIRLANMIARPDFNIFYNAPLLIMIFAHPDAFSPQIDCALAAENMMLAARSLGIGSCWIGLAAVLGQAREIMNELGVPADCKLMGCLILGYPSQLDLKAPGREENVILKWIE